MRKTTIKAKAVLAMLLAGTLLSACNTVEGAGRDVKSAGDAIEDAGD